MSYGLFDGDMNAYPHVPFFNLDLMKISAYYKSRREIVTLSPVFSPMRYQNFIARQDFQGRMYPYTKYKHVQYGGRAFNPNSYKPLPLEIEQMKPDTYLYNKIAFRFNDTKQWSSAFKRMRDAEHIRLSLDGKTVWENFESQLKHDSQYVGLALHDYDLGAIENSYETVIDILKDYRPYREGCRIGMKFPVQVNNATDLLNWGSIKPMFFFYSIQYNGVMPEGLLEQFLDVTNHTSGAVQSYYNVTEGMDYEHFITQDIINLYKQVCTLRRRRINFPLIYDENFFLDKQWIRVLELFNRFVAYIAASRKLKNIAPLGKDSLYLFAKKYSYQKTKKNISSNTYKLEDLREIFQFVRENNYELFKLFYEYRF